MNNKIKIMIMMIVMIALSVINISHALSSEFPPDYQNKINEAQDQNLPQWVQDEADDPTPPNNSTDENEVEYSGKIDPRILQGKTDKAWFVPEETWNPVELKKSANIHVLQYDSEGLRQTWTMKSRQNDEYIKWVTDKYLKDHWILYTGTYGPDKELVTKYMGHGDRMKFINDNDARSISFSIEPHEDIQINDWPCAFPGPSRNNDRLKSCTIILRDKKGGRSALDIYFTNTIDTSNIYEGDILSVSGTLARPIGSSNGSIFLNVSGVSVLASEVLKVYRGSNSLAFK